MMMIEIVLHRATEMDKITGEDELTPEKKAKEYKQVKTGEVQAWELDPGLFHWPHCTPLPKDKGLTHYEGPDRP